MANNRKFHCFLPDLQVFVMVHCQLPITNNHSPWNLLIVCQVLQASYVTPGLCEGAAVNFVSVYEMRDEAAQIISLAFNAVAGQQWKDSRRKDVDTRGDKAGARL
jgi:hypothetical protein